MRHDDDSALQEPEPARAAGSSLRAPSTAPVWIVDVDLNRFVWANPAALAHFEAGDLPSLLERRSVLTPSAIERLRALRDALADAPAREIRVAAEGVGAGPTGGGGTAYLRARPLQSGQIGVRIERRDLRDRSNADPAPRAIDAPSFDASAFEAALSTLGACAVSLDADGVIRRIDAAAPALFARPAATLVGQPLVAFLDDPARRKLASLFKNGPIVSGLAYGRRIAAELRHTDSAPAAPVTLAISRLRDSGAPRSGPLRFVATIARRSLSDQSDVVRAPRMGAQDLAGRLGHALRTPLTAVIGYAELARRDASMLQNARSLEHLEAILDAGAELTRIVERLVVDGEDIDAPSWIEPQRFIADSVADLTARAERQNVRLTIDLSDAPRRIVAAPDRVRAALRALVVHAIDTVGAGGRVLLHSVRTEEGGVSFECVDDGPGWRLCAANDPTNGRDLRALIDHVRALGAPDDLELEFESVPGAGASIRLTFPADRVVALVSERPH